MNADNDLFSKSKQQPKAKKVRKSNRTEQNKTFIIEDPEIAEIQSKRIFPVAQK